MDHHKKERFTVNTNVNNTASRNPGVFVQLDHQFMKDNADIYLLLS